MINSNLVSTKDRQKEEKIPFFPVLAKYLSGTFVVLFTGKNKGTIVWVNKHSVYSLGLFRDDWCSVDDLSCWKILRKDEVIELSNG